jgi:hypothetical protein
MSGSKTSLTTLRPEASLKGSTSPFFNTTQEETLQAAIAYRDRRAEELGLEAKPHRGPHTEAARKQMSGHHNRLGLQGLGLSLDNLAGIIYPQLTAMWTGEEGQKKVKRGLASRGI